MNLCLSTDWWTEYLTLKRMSLYSSVHFIVHLWLHFCFCVCHNVITTTIWIVCLIQTYKNRRNRKELQISLKEHLWVMHRVPPFKVRRFFFCSSSKWSLVSYMLAFAFFLYNNVCSQSFLSTFVNIVFLFFIIINIFILYVNILVFIPVNFQYFGLWVSLIHVPI